MAGQGAGVANGIEQETREFFERIRDRLAGNFVFAHALDGDRVVSSELALLSASRQRRPSPSGKSLSQSCPLAWSRNET